MDPEKTINEILTLASQHHQAGFPGFSRIRSILQLTITGCSNLAHWSFDRDSSTGFSKIAAPNPRYPLAELSKETLLSILTQQQNIQQAYLDSKITIYGEVQQSIFFTRLFAQLQQVALENQEQVTQYH